MNFTDALGTIRSLIDLVPPGVVPALDAVKSLAALATAVGATVADAKHAYELISGHADGTVEIELIESEIEALEARGLKPIDPPED